MGKLVPAIQQHDLFQQSLNREEWPGPARVCNERSEWSLVCKQLLVQERGL